MNLVIVSFPILFLIAYSTFYFNIGIVYYKNITLLEETALVLNSLEIGRQSQIRGNSNHLELTNFRDNVPNITQVYKPRFQFINLISTLKMFIIILIPFIEILPVSIVLILHHFVEIRNYRLIENICYWIVGFIPLTNSLMILILHRETWEKFCNLITHA
ncbi:hypothetical protein CONCODRAFT_11514 [Conidiobolus coronatus NRRL 28638]|uniref:G-protein coupled receptors family 1 profile domain-containing protein n=1 Tax=Conidiobolus coronatus (strain ATCC 28846 / CBS 209.66 / NRRL 28638) TaxID=796925 RepID=A0A137NUY1_CONC2|nr:hypothetical protein CONCODRAFT_11514 [Conidiobolus coronatus NRRL 28638]|eukprot:KXN66590.1 hypothetical protein CONCODRAFT_11514 [Conidiobolus coronatus NRRL 28638]